MDYINDFSKKLKFLVGMNGSGKTYALKEALDEQEQRAFLITEDGMPIIPRHMNQVVIDLERSVYRYNDEISRGELDRDTEEENISDKAMNVIIFCNEIINRLDIFLTKSKGQEKLYNMMSIFTTYNLNHISVIYFDEPENFLDEEFLKIISEFFILLTSNDYIVRVATHNARLLNIMKVSLEDIIFFHTHSQFSVSEIEIKEMYHSTSNKIEQIRTQHNIQSNASIQYKLDLVNNVQAFDNFIEQSLKSEEFYRCLFYRKIIIVEGNSDIVALSSMKNEFDSSIEVYNPNGKAFIPFFVQLFLELKKDLVVIIDGDIPLQENDNPLQHPVAITYFLREIYTSNEIKLVIHTPDLEGYYNIDLNEIGDILGMSNSVRRANKGWHKALAAFIFFSEEVNKELLKNHILGMPEDNPFEFQ